MTKLLKYNFKESARLLAPLLIALFVLNMFPDILIDKLPGVWSGVLYGLGNTVIIITIVVHLGRSFSIEFNEDRRFLTFTLPINGQKLILAKLINTTLWLGILWLTLVLDGLFIAIRLGNLHFGDINFGLLNVKFSTIILSSIMLILIGLVIYIYLMLSGYFTETLTKLMYTGKSGFIRTIITIILWLLQLKITTSIASFFAIRLPSYYNFINGNFSIKKLSIEINFNDMMQGFIEAGYINLTAMIAVTLISVAYFFGMAYLIDNKLDL